MKKEISGPAMAAILALAAIIAVSVGWYVINRPTGTVSVSGNSVKMEGARGGHTLSNQAPADAMPGSQ